MKTLLKKYVLVQLLILSLLGVSYAQLPNSQMQGGITYISGGVGQDEVNAMKTESKKWPLGIEFSEYLVNEELWVAQVDLRIEDAKGSSVFEAVVDGPIFLAKLPPGNYELIASYDGVAQTRMIQIVDGKSLYVSMNWRLAKNRV